MDQNLLLELKKVFKGEILTDPETILTYSHCASLFEIKPQAVVFPIDDEDIKNLVQFINTHKKKYPDLSLTARAAGTDMGGGSINDSIIVAFGKHMNKFLGLKSNIASAQPGMFYREFEKETLKSGLIFPSYPASREICAIGGIVSNNSGGEKSLEYGKTENFIEQLNVILSNGMEYELTALNEQELNRKLKLKDFEGQIYRKMYKLINENYELLQNAK